MFRATAQGQASKAGSLREKPFADVAPELLVKIKDQLVATLAPWSEKEISAQILGAYGLTAYQHYQSLGRADETHAQVLERTAIFILALEQQHPAQDCVGRWSAELYRSVIGQGPREAVRAYAFSQEGIGRVALQPALAEAFSALRELLSYVADGEETAAILLLQQADSLEESFQSLNQFLDRVWKAQPTLIEAIQKTRQLFTRAALSEQQAPRFYTEAPAPALIWEKPPVALSREDVYDLAQDCLNIFPKDDRIALFETRYLVSRDEAAQLRRESDNVRVNDVLLARFEALGQASIEFLDWFRSQILQRRLPNGDANLFLKPWGKYINATYPVDLPSGQSLTLARENAVQKAYPGLALVWRRVVNREHGDHAIDVYQRNAENPKQGIRRGTIKAEELVGFSSAQELGDAVAKVARVDAVTVQEPPPGLLISPEVQASNPEISEEALAEATARQEARAVELSPMGRLLEGLGADRPFGKTLEDEESGFVVGGWNHRDNVWDLDTLNGVKALALKLPFLNGAKLLDVMFRDNGKITELGLTHQGVAYLLRHVISDAAKNGGFSTVQGQRFRVQTRTFRGSEVQRGGSEPSAKALAEAFEQESRELDFSDLVETYSEAPASTKSPKRGGTESPLKDGTTDSLRVTMTLVGADGKDQAVLAVTSRDIEMIGRYGIYPMGLDNLLQFFSFLRSTDVVAEEVAPVTPPAPEASVASKVAGAAGLRPELQAALSRPDQLNINQIMEVVGTWYGITIVPARILRAGKDRGAGNYTLKRDLNNPKLDINVYFSEAPTLAEFSKKVAQKLGREDVYASHVSAPAVQASVVAAAVPVAEVVTVAAPVAGAAFVKKSAKILEIENWYPRTPVAEGDGSGFMRYGVNSSDTIRQLKKLFGKLIAQIEAAMRRGAISQSGMMLPDDRLIDLLVQENEATHAAGWTHLAKANVLRKLVELAGRGRGKIVQLEGIQYEVDVIAYRGEGDEGRVLRGDKDEALEADQQRNQRLLDLFEEETGKAFRGSQESPFGDGALSNIDVKIRRVDTGETVRIGGLIIEMMASVGFNEPTIEQYGLSTAKFLRMFGEMLGVAAPIVPSSTDAPEASEATPPAAAVEQSFDPASLGVALHEKLASFGVPARPSAQPLTPIEEAVRLAYQETVYLRREGGLILYTRSRGGAFIVGRLTEEEAASIPDAKTLSEVVARLAKVKVQRVEEPLTEPTAIPPATPAAPASTDDYLKNIAAAAQAPVTQPAHRPPVVSHPAGILVPAAPRPAEPLGAVPTAPSELVVTVGSLAVPFNLEPQGLQQALFAEPELTKIIGSREGKVLWGILQGLLAHPQVLSGEVVLSPEAYEAVGAGLAKVVAASVVQLGEMEGHYKQWNSKLSELALDGKDRRISNKLRMMWAALTRALAAATEQRPAPAVSAPVAPTVTIQSKYSQVVQLHPIFNAFRDPEKVRAFFLFSRDDLKRRSDEIPPGRLSLGDIVSHAAGQFDVIASGVISEEFKLTLEQAIRVDIQGVVTEPAVRLARERPDDTELYQDNFKLLLRYSLTTAQLQRFVQSHLSGQIVPPGLLERHRDFSDWAVQQLVDAGKLTNHRNLTMLYQAAWDLANGSSASVSAVPQSPAPEAAPAELPVRLNGAVTLKFSLRQEGESLVIPGEEMARVLGRYGTVDLLRRILFKIFDEPSVASRQIKLSVEACTVIGAALTSAVVEFDESPAEVQALYGELRRKLVDLLEDDELGKLKAMRVAAETALKAAESQPASAEPVVAATAVPSTVSALIDLIETVGEPGKMNAVVMFHPETDMNMVASQVPEPASSSPSSMAIAIGNAYWRVRGKVAPAFVQALTHARGVDLDGPVSEPVVKSSRPLRENEKTGVEEFRHLLLYRFTTRQLEKLIADKLPGVRMPAGQSHRELVIWAVPHFAKAFDFRGWAGHHLYREVWGIVNP